MSDLTDSLNKARQRVLAGEELTLEEQREMLRQLREVRGTIAAAPAPKKSSKSKAAAPAMTQEELDASLADFGL